MQLKEVEQLVHEETTNQFLQEQFSGPAKDKDQMLWLHEAVRGSGLSETVRYRVISATLYVIQAHDTHDMIDEKNDPFPLARQDRELMVLAGDYYSALYYRTMAELGMTALLAKLQKGVQETNTAKTNLLELHLATDQALFEALRQASSAIFEQFARYFECEENFIELASKVLLLKQLLLEEKNSRAGHISKLLPAYEHGYFAHSTSAGFDDWLFEIIADLSQDILRLKEEVTGLSDGQKARIQELLKR